MNRPAVAAGLIAVLAACFGASIARQKAAGQLPGAGAAPAEQQPVDQQKPLPLTAVRAPADLGARALEHVRAIVGFGSRHSGRTPTPGWSQQLDYIAADLQRSGLEVK